jgi:hypothetical protein
MRRFAQGLAAVLILGGCGSGQPYEVASVQPISPARNVEAEMEATAKRCEERHPNKASKKPITPFMACFMDADIEYWSGRNAMRHNMAIQAKAETVAVTDQYDAGKMSRERLQAELQLVAARQSERLALAAQQYADLERQQLEADRQRSMALFAAGARIMSPPTISCSTFGNTTTCR